MASSMQTLLSDEIQRIVGQAAKDGTSLSLSACVEQVMKAIPGTRMSEREITSEILIAATSAMVAIVMDRKYAS